MTDAVRSHPGNDHVWVAVLASLDHAAMVFDGRLQLQAWSPAAVALCPSGRELDLRVGLTLEGIRTSCPFLLHCGLFPSDPAAREHDQRVMCGSPEAGTLVARWSPLPDGGWFVSFTHRSDQLEAEQERQLWEQAIAHAPEAIIVTQLDGRILRVNPAFTRITGYRAEEAIGQHPGALFRPSDPAALPDREVMRQMMASERWEGEITFQHRDGTLVPAWVANSTIYGPEGQPTRRMSIFSDLRERKRLENALKSALAEKDEFVSVVSHELRTPLTSLFGSLRLLEARLRETPEPVQDLLRIALRNSERLMNLIDDLLDLERVAAPHLQLDLQPWSCHELLDQAVNLMLLLAHGSGVTLQVEPTDAWARADGDRVLQTLTNLLSNAIKFSHPGGPIWLSAERQGDEVLFSVRDEGRGIPSHLVEAIFDRFQQVDASDSRMRGGSGLGLAICRSIVERHGGRIWAESELGFGSTFRFTLPGAPPGEAHS